MGKTDGANKKNLLLLPVLINITDNLQIHRRIIAISPYNLLLGQFFKG
jgi:hypothetical protein